MRKPDDRRCSAVASWLPEVDRLRCAFSDRTFVLMTWAMTLRLLQVSPDPGETGACYGYLRHGPIRVPVLRLHPVSVHRRGT